jgi:hypothetical protein
MDRKSRVSAAMAFAAVALGLSALGLMVAASAAAAAPTWLAPLELSAAGQDASRPEVAIDQQSNATAVWERFNGSNWIIQSAERPVGGGWSEPVDLTAPGHDAKFSQVAVDEQGNTTAVWESFNGSNWIIQSAERPVGGAWSAPVDLSSAGQDALITKVAVDPLGNATAVWRRFNGSNWIIQSAERQAGGAWSAPVDLSAAGQDAKFPEMTVDPLGNATAVWRRFNGSNWIIQSAERPVGGAWSAPVDLSAAGQDAGSPQVAVDPEGGATAIWQRFNIIQSAERAGGGSWSGPVNLSAAGQEVRFPQVAIDSQGNATATWGRFNGSNWIIQSAERQAGGAWSAPVDLSAAGQDAEWANVVVGPLGNTTAIWQHFNGSNWIIQSAERQAGGAWSGPVDLSAAGQDASIPHVALDPQGNATAIWPRSNGSNQIIQSAERQAVDTSVLGSTPVSPPTAPGSTTPSRRSTVRAAGIARVVRGTVLLRLQCRGYGRCRGVIKLIAQSREEMSVKRNGRKLVRRRAKRILIGKTRFSIPAGGSTLLRVRLSNEGAAMLHRTRHHRLKVRLQGRDVGPRWVVLKEARDAPTGSSVR